MNRDGTNMINLTNSETHESSPVWSPDGARILFVSNRDGAGAIFVMDAYGANVQRLTDSSMLCLYPSWSPDGTRIAFTRLDGGIYVMDADGGNLRRLTYGDEYQPSLVWRP
jgi:Tol biopolymer transport system component